MCCKILVYLVTIFSAVRALQYDFVQTFQLLESSIRCLENYGTLSENATMEVAVAHAFITNILEENPTITEEMSAPIRELQRRAKNIILRSIEDHPNSPMRFIWLSDYWHDCQDFSFGSNKIEILPPLDKTYAEVLENSIRDQFTLDCLHDLLVENEFHDGYRECKMRCLPEMSMTDYNYHISPEERAYYLAIADINNCSNYSPQQYEEIVWGFCAYCRIELDVMLKEKRSQTFRDTLYFAFTKAAFCSCWGVEQFIDYITATSLLEFIDCDGCFGSHLPKEDQSVVTALGAQFLTSLLRYTVEQSLKQPVIARPIPSRPNNKIKVNKNRLNKHRIKLY